MGWGEIEALHNDEAFSEEDLGLAFRTALMKERRAILVEMVQIPDSQRGFKMEIFKVPPLYSTNFSSVDGASTPPFLFACGACPGCRLCLNRCLAVSL
jgi:hypothetical protein